MSSPGSSRIAIIGGGIAGVVLALALVRRDIDVRLYERGAKFAEYGAGMGMTATAVKSMEICVGNSEVYQAFRSIISHPKNGGVNMEIRDGWNIPSKGGFINEWDGVSGGVHRVQLLNTLVKFLPEGITEFSKNLMEIEESMDQSAPLKLIFADGTTAFADAVVGCDGIGSHVRRHLVGKEHPSARAKYANRYAYRALLPMEAAIKSLGEERPFINTMWMGYDSQVVCVGVAGGKIMSVTAIKDNPSPWPSEKNLVLPAKKEDVLDEFKGWGPEVQSILANVTPNVDRWALFDLAENPLPFFAKGRVCLIGDAAHATTPHLGSGAAFSMEDAAVLAELLGDKRVQGRSDGIEAAFQAYNVVRLPRGHWLSIKSRENGSLLHFADPDVGDDMARCEEKILGNFREAWVAKSDIFVDQAKAELDRLLQQT